MKYLKAFFFITAVSLVIFIYKLVFKIECPDTFKYDFFYLLYFWAGCTFEYLWNRWES